MGFETVRIWEIGGRDTQQDSYGVTSSGSAYCWVVADGLGGHRGGEVASSAAVKAAVESFRQNPDVSSSAIEGHLNAANEAVLALRRDMPEVDGMRTTIVLLVADAGRCTWGHVGDSRLYYFHRNRLAARTLDHSVPQAMALASQIHEHEIRFHPDRNRLLRCIGESCELRPSIPEGTRELVAGDAFLLCTDGFWELVTEAELEADLILSDAPGDWLARAGDRLQSRVREGNDNYSAIAVFHGTRSPWWRKWFLASRRQEVMPQMTHRKGETQ